MFFTTIIPFDEDSNNDIESDSRDDPNNMDISEEELLEIFQSNLVNIAPDYQIELVPRRHSPLFTTDKEKYRGKQVINPKKPRHSRKAFDNLQRKIQVHFFTFIIRLSNDAIKAVLGSKTPHNFKQIDYQLKILINHEEVNNLHKLAIKDLMEKEISPKNKKSSANTNKDTLNKVCQISKSLKDFFDIKYLDFFNDFYFNEEKETDKITFKGKEIPFSNKTKNFYHLLKKYEKDKSLLIDAAKSIYFNGYDSLIRNNSFVTSRKDIELNEWLIIN